MEPSATPDAAATTAPAAAPPELVEELELDEGLGLTRQQLFAIYGLLIGGAVALALYRATRKRAGGYGAGVAPPAGVPRVNIDELDLPPAVRQILEHYAAAQQEALGAAAHSLERLERRMSALEGRVATATAGRPAPRGAEPMPAPSGAAVSVNVPEEARGVDAGELPALADELGEEALIAPAIPPAAVSTNGDEPATVAPAPVVRALDDDEPLGPGMRPAAVGHAPGAE